LGATYIMASDGTVDGWAGPPGYVPISIITGKLTDWHRQAEEGRTLRERIVGRAKADAGEEVLGGAIAALEDAKDRKGGRGASGRRFA
jgi:hypothetical protein